jgi:glucosamine-6-phosphate deaminase
MHLHVLPDRARMSAAAAEDVAARLRRLLAERGRVRMVAATAASQIEFQHALAAAPGIDWTRVDLFQLDEYIGLPADHPARFSRLLAEHLMRPAGITSAHLIDVDAPDLVAARARMNAELAEPLDLAVVGIGENGHLAFNDPPADFAATDSYLIVALDEACRRQQVGEGWFARLEDVPARAMTMSIAGILRAREIVAVVPDARKAEAVRAALDGDVTPLVPASILRTHEHVTMYLDEAAARLRVHGATPRT